MSKRPHLVYRIAIPFALLIIATLAALGAYLSGFFTDTYLAMLRQTLQAETQLVASQLATLYREATPEPQALQERASQYDQLLDRRVTIIDLDGMVLADTYEPASQMDNHRDRPEVQAALRGVASTELRHSDTLQTDVLYAAAPIMDEKGIAGVARLSVPLNAIQRSQASLRRTILAASAITAALAILLGSAIAFYTIQPLRRLTDTVQRISAGEPVDIPAAHRRDEVGQLQQSFRHLTHQLKDQIQQVKTERSTLALILANMTDAVIIADSQGNVQLINQAGLALFQQPGEQAAIGRPLVEIVRQHQLVELWRLSVTSSEQQAITLETSPRRLFVQAIATPLNPSLPGMTLLVFQDLTRVRRLETVRRDFVSNVSHELRTPLAALKALTETLQEGAIDDPPAARRFLQRMETEIDNLTQMVHELLELSRIESNRFPLQRAAVSPCELAAPPVERMQLQAQRAGLRLDMDCPTSLPAVQADPERIAQVLVNLLHNAIKFTPPGGEIHVRGYQEGEMVVFAVQDTGQGISEEALGRIFERFYKADPSRSGGGTGLGLSIARHIIEAHGGRIWVESTLHQGSTFFFSLPLAGAG